MYNPTKDEIRIPYILHLNFFLGPLEKGWESFSLNIFWKNNFLLVNTRISWVWSINKKWDPFYEYLKKGEIKLLFNLRLTLFRSIVYYQLCSHYFFLEMYTLKKQFNILWRNIFLCNDCFCFWARTVLIVLRSAHLRCVFTSVGKLQPPLRKHSTVFTFHCGYLKYLHRLKIPPTVKFIIKSVKCMEK